jgi:hypothetical protein
MLRRDETFVSYRISTQLEVDGRQAQNFTNKKDMRMSLKMTILTRPARNSCGLPFCLHTLAGSVLVALPIKLYPLKS